MDDANANHVQLATCTWVTRRLGPGLVKLKLRKLTTATTVRRVLRARAAQASRRETEI